jgi:hypothetical protein
LFFQWVGPLTFLAAMSTSLRKLFFRKLCKFIT